MYGSRSFACPGTRCEKAQRGGGGRPPLGGGRPPLGGGFHPEAVAWHLRGGGGVLLQAVAAPGRWPGTSVVAAVVLLQAVASAPGRWPGTTWRWPPSSLEVVAGTPRGGGGRPPRGVLHLEGGRPPGRRRAPGGGRAPCRCLRGQVVEAWQLPVMVADDHIPGGGFLSTGWRSCTTALANPAVVSLRHQVAVRYLVLANQEVT